MGMARVLKSDFLKSLGVALAPGFAILKIFIFSLKTSTQMASQALKLGSGLFSDDLRWYGGGLGGVWERSELIWGDMVSVDFGQSRADRGVGLGKLAWFRNGW